MRAKTILFHAAVLHMLSACGGPAPEQVTQAAGVPDAGTPCDPATSACRVTITSRGDELGAIDLAVARETIVPRFAQDLTGASSPVDLFLSMGRYLTLSGTSNTSLCLVGVGYSQLAEVPEDSSACQWTSAQFFGVITDPYQGSEGVGRGLLVRDRSGSAIYKMLISLDLVAYETVGENEKSYVGSLAFSYARTAL